MPITHAKVSGEPDGLDTALIQPTDWNDDHVGTGGAALAELITVTIDLSTAEIATLNSAPVEVVAAQGVGTVIVPVAASLQYKAGTQPFATGNADFDLVWTGGLFAMKARPEEAPFDNLVDYLLVFSTSTGSLAPESTQADAENTGLSLESADDDIGLSGSILTSSLNTGGQDFAVNDTFTVGPSDTATGVGDTVDGGGAILTYHLTAVGTAYGVGQGADLHATTGIGTGASINIDTITPLSDGTARLTVLYYVMELL